MNYKFNKYGLFTAILSVLLTATAISQCQTTTLSMSGTNVSCFGGANGSANVTASGDSPFTYTWSPLGGNASLATGLSQGTYTCAVTNSCGIIATNTIVINQPSALVTSTAVTNVACSGGSNGVASITASGGAGGYTYLWSNAGTTSAITGQMAGVYTATVTDANSCTSIKSANITQPSALATTTVVTNVACNGGSNGVASITASGGVGGYTYLWSNAGTTSAITGQMAGVYTATVTDANSCTSIKSANITQPNALVTTTAVTNVACNGGSNGVASITASGGVGGYTYLWSNAGTTSAITGQMAGVYTATVTDANSCTSIKSANITQPNALVTTTAVTNVACNGGSNGVASITASGGVGGYTYLWSNAGTTSAITGQMAGVYTATVTDANSCTSIKSANITQPNALTTTTAVTNVACNGGSNGSANITATGGTGAYTYSWSTAATTSVVSGLMAGVYTATVTDANSCTSIKSVQIAQPAALATTTAVTNVACNGGSNGSANITATGGTGAYTYSWSTAATTSVVSGLMAGVYTATVTDANSCTSTKSVNITQPLALATTTAVTNIACNGGSNGSASITATGGTGTYTYLWSTAATTSVVSGLMVGVYTATVTDANSCTSTKSVNITQPLALATTTAVTNALCNGGTGSASITATGGTGAYTYSWSTAATTSVVSGLMAGVYTATVTDANSCTSTKSVQVTQPATALVTTTAVTNIVCNGGTASASITATGGTGAYTYSWSTAATTSVVSGLLAGTYTITVKDANLCTSTKSVQVTQPSAIVITTAVTSALCNGGTASASITVTGGTGAYTYSWSTAATTSVVSGLIAGAYTATVTDANACTSTKSVQVTQPAALATTTAVTNVLCNGGTGSASVTTTGGTGAYTYSWSTAATTSVVSGLLPGTYTITVKDANLCTSTKSVQVTQPATALATSTAVTNALCNGATGSASVTATGGTGAYTYSWSTAATTSVVSGLLAGTYTITVKDANLCTSTKTTTITEPSAITATINASSTACTASTGSASVTNVSGGTGAYTYSWSTSATTTSVTALGGGIVTCSVTDANGCVITKSVNILTTNGPTLSIASQTNVLCFNAATGAASLTAGGGTAPYTYTWSNGPATSNNNNLTAGSYTGTVTDANGCTSVLSVTLTQPATALSSSISSQNNVLCNGASNGSVAINATGGTGAYSYSWAPAGGTTASATALSAGAYTCTITDANACTQSIVVTVTQPAAITGTQSVNLCFGKSLTVGTSTYTTSGTYTNTLAASNGCDSLLTTILVVSPAINVATSINANVITATQTGATYKWLDCDNANAAINGETGQSFSATASGNYAVVVTVGNCSDTSACVSMNFTGISKQALTEGFAIYPNPSETGNFTIRLSQAAQVQICDILGRSVYNKNLEAGTQSVNFTEEKNGVYFVKISSGQKQSSVRIIINK